MQDVWAFYVILNHITNPSGNVTILYNYKHSVTLPCRWSRYSTCWRATSGGAKRCGWRSGPGLLLGVPARHAPSLAPLPPVRQVPPPDGPPLPVPQYLHCVQQPLALCCVRDDKSLADGGVRAWGVHCHHAQNRRRRLGRKAVSTYVVSPEWKCVGPANDNMQCCLLRMGLPSFKVSILLSFCFCFDVCPMSFEFVISEYAYTYFAFATSTWAAKSGKFSFNEP